MSSITAWTRPSTLLLAAILAANLTLPLVHFWPEPADAVGDSVGSAPRPGRSIPPTAPREAAATRLAVEPVEVPALPRRPVPPAPVQLCRQWGPFDEAAEAEAVAARLGFAAADFTVHPVDLEAASEYLVTVQATGPGRTAARTVRALKSQNIESYVLDRPGNVLAVGVFRNPARAESQRRRMTELGYQADIESLFRSQRVYHLLARTTADFEPDTPAAGACGEIAPTHRFL